MTATTTARPARAASPRAALCTVLLLAALAGGPSPARAHAGHDHGAPAAAASATPSSPRLESATELFELVARLGDAGLELWLNRHATSEPVAGARIEIDSAGQKAVAAFDPASESYRLAEGPLLAALRQPGTHALVLTVTAGEDADLLEGSLTVPDAAAGDDHPHGLAALPPWAWALGGAGLTALLFGAAGWLRRRGSAVGTAHRFGEAA